jgi:PKD repeat protein
VPFSGRGFDPNGGAFLRYQWSFGGAAPNIISANPGTVTFTQVGSYVVSLLVINQQGIPDPHPPHVVITVTP